MIYDYILLIDDDPVCHYIHQKLFVLAGISMQIFTALSGKKGLQILSEECQKGRLPCIILVDINMPRMNGFEFIEQLATLDIPITDVRIYILSSSDNILDQQRARAQGNVFHTKPLLLETVKTLQMSSGALQSASPDV